jgi:hypothetical protein
MFAKSRLILSLAAVCATIPAAHAAAPASAAVTITGPIAVTAESGDSYRGSNEQPVAGPGLPPPMLTPFNYVQEEYFVSGTVDGKPYLTNLLVRKPKDPKKFSGLVGVETIHAAGAIPFWGSGREVWMPGGHAWIAVASQRSALEVQVKKFNPKRYVQLQVPEAAAAAGAAPANGLNGGAQDLISQAIMTQIGQMLKSNRKDGPLAGMTVKYLLMGGSSQTGATTLHYIQQSHAGARMPNGKPVYDGYLPMEAFVSGPLSGGDAAVIHAVGEGDFGLFTSFPGSPAIAPAREDSDAPNDRYREYQYPGASHVPTRGATTGGEGALLPSQFPTAPLYKGAMLNLISWVTKGVPPPKSPRLERVDGVIARDEFGNAKGGIRTPYVDVPTVRYIASPPVVAGGDRSRAMMGLQEPFSPDKLRSLYQTRENYLQRFNQSADKLAAGRWVTPEDAAKLKQEEAEHPPF